MTLQAVAIHLMPDGPYVTWIVADKAFHEEWLDSGPTHMREIEENVKGQSLI